MQEIKNIVISGDAAEDMVDGQTFYENLELGLGRYFWDSITSDIESLILYAGVHQQYFSFFRLLSKRFPYCIYYEIVEAIVYVVAVLPMRNDPAGIEGAIENRG